MSSSLLLAVATCVSLAVSLLLTGVVLRMARRHGLLDLPNERSSHQVPTPRGGGIAIVVASAAGLLILAKFGSVKSSMIMVVLGGGIAVAAVGFIDDRRPLSARTRLLVHASAALSALAALGGLPPIQLGSYVLHPGWGGFVAGTLAIIWVLNLYNFMDGIDGIAAAEAVFVLVSGALLAHMSTGAGAASHGAIVVAAAALGFLAWNWAPARIFMGDVGSGYLGYVIAVLAIASAVDSPATILSWLILGGVFFCDATVTLIRRFVRGERLSQAHRSHAYQRLARRWNGHARVTMSILLIDCCWLLPLAIFAIKHPDLAAWTALAALAPIALLAIVLDAGGREKSTALSVDSVVVRPCGTPSPATVDQRTD